MKFFQRAGTFGVVGGFLLGTILFGQPGLAIAWGKSYYYYQTTYMNPGSFAYDAYALP